MSTGYQYYLSIIFVISYHYLTIILVLHGVWFLPQQRGLAEWLLLQRLQWSQQREPSTPGRHQSGA